MAENEVKKGRVRERERKEEGVGGEWRMEGREKIENKDNMHEKDMKRNLFSSNFCE
jgi:hypothetical protein